MGSKLSVHEKSRREPGSSNNQISSLDSLYAAYKREFEDVYTVWEPGIGFANWKREGDGIYVQEVYIAPGHRGQRWAAKLTDRCLGDAKNRLGSKILRVYTSIGLGGKTIDMSIRAITEYGFKLLSATPDIIYFYKDLDNE